MFYAPPRGTAYRSVANEPRRLPAKIARRRCEREERLTIHLGQKRKEKEDAITGVEHRVKISIGGQREVS